MGVWQWFRSMIGSTSAETEPKESSTARTSRRPNTPSSPTRLVDNGDGTINDHETGLMWQKEDDGVERTHAEAIAYCDGLSLAGFDDWRLPSLQEFQRFTQGARASDLGIVAHCSVSTGSYYWTATSGPENTVAYIADGTTMFKRNTYCVRAVRKAA